MWAYATRTLTQSGAAVTAAVAGSTLNIRRGDTYNATLSSLTFTADATRTESWFTIKTSRGDADSASILMITEDEGLTVLNGAAATTATDASITIDATAGTIAIMIKPAATVQLLRQSAMHYDVQELTSTGVINTITDGDEKANIIEDVTRATTDV